jgi:DNA polymerase-3 subunit epsilon
MREVVLDTETTGFDPLSGHRIVEIGCIELINHLPGSAEPFHVYLNPERDMPEAAFKVHGLSAEFLADKPLFADIVDDFLAFLDDAPLVIHNAEFDMRFINAELTRLGRPTLPMSRSIDTVALARKRFPGAQANLDALCRRFEIDNSHRTRHGALLDSELLAEVYLQLIGGRQPGLELATASPAAQAAARSIAAERVARPARPHAPTPEEAEAHAAFIAKLKGALWTRPA